MKTLRFGIRYPESKPGETRDEYFQRMREARNAHWQEWADVITSLTPFRAGKRLRYAGHTTLRGVLGVPYLPGMTADGIGSLPEPHRTLFRKTYLDYVIYSYDTPIAWRGTYPADNCHRWHVPAVDYSQTTSDHQWEIIASLKHAGIEYTTGEPVNTRKGKGRSPFGPREGGRGW